MRIDRSMIPRSRISMARAFFASERLSKRYTKTLVSTSAATIVEIFAFPAAVVRLRLFALSALPLFLTLDGRPEHPQAQLDRGRIILTGALRRDPDRIPRRLPLDLVARLDSVLFRKLLGDRDLQ